MQQSGFSLRPKGITFVTPFWRSGLDQVVHQPEGVLLIPQIAEGVVPVRLLQVDQIQHPDVVAVLFQPASGGDQHLHFRVGNDIIGVGLQDVGNHIRPTLTGAGTAYYQHIQRPTVLVGVQPQADIFRQQFVLLLSEHGVDLPGRGPGSGAVFLAVPCPALVGLVEGDPHDVGPGADQDGQQTAVCPLDLKGMLNGRRQIIDDLRQTAAQGLRDEQRRPNNGDVEEKIKGEAA